jgi:hypothetical protein
MKAIEHHFGLRGWPAVGEAIGQEYPAVGATVHVHCQHLSAASVRMPGRRNGAGISEDVRTTTLTDAAIARSDDFGRRMARIC